MNKNNKKVLIFSLSYFPKEVGGAEIAVKEITDRFSQNFEFDLITLGKSENSPIKIGKVNVYSVGFGGGNLKSKLNILNKTFYPIFAFLKAVRLYKRNRYDAIWALMASYAGLAGIFFKFFYPKVPFILTLQEGDSFEHPKRKIIKFLYKKIIKSADVIQAISNYLSIWANEMHPKAPIYVIPNGVDYKRFGGEIEPSKIREVLHEIGKKEGDIFLVTTSRLVTKNAVEDIITSLKYLDSHIKLLVIGTGNLQDRLKKLVKDFDIESRVIFMGFISNEDLPRYLKVCDIFIRPSLSEGFGNSFIEAMALGIPIIATPVGGIIDFLKDEETGLFCEPENPKNIAQKVEKLLKDKESSQYIVENAKKLVRENYDWSKISSEMEKLFIKYI